MARDAHAGRSPIMIAGSGVPACCSPHPAPGCQVPGVALAVQSGRGWPHRHPAHGPRGWRGKRPIRTGPFRTPRPGRAHRTPRQLWRATPAHVHQGLPGAGPFVAQNSPRQAGCRCGAAARPATGDLYFPVRPGPCAARTCRRKPLPWLHPTGFQAKPGSG